MDGCDAMRDAISIGVCPPRRESSESLIRFKIDPGGAAVPACCRAEGPPLCQQEEEEEQSSAG